MSEAGVPDWASGYARPVSGVADIERSAAFYVGKLGCREDWRYAAGGPLIVQVSRKCCEPVLSAQRPERVGFGLIFLSLDFEIVNAVRAEFTAHDVEVKYGRCGESLMIAEDPDGNPLYFPNPSYDEGPA